MPIFSKQKVDNSFLQLISVPVKVLQFSGFQNQLSHRDRSTNGAVSRLDRFVLG